MHRVAFIFPCVLIVEILRYVPFVCGEGSVLELGLGDVEDEFFGCDSAFVFESDEICLGRAAEAVAFAESDGKLKAGSAGEYARCRDLCDLREVDRELCRFEQIAQVEGLSGKSQHGTFVVAGIGAEADHLAHKRRTVIGQFEHVVHVGIGECEVGDDHAILHHDIREVDLDGSGCDGAVVVECAVGRLCIAFECGAVSFKFGSHVDAYRSCAGEYVARSYHRILGAADIGAACIASEDVEYGALAVGGGHVLESYVGERLSVADECQAVGRGHGLGFGRKLEELWIVVVVAT